MVLLGAMRLITTAQYVSVSKKRVTTTRSQGLVVTEVDFPEFTDAGRVCSRNWVVGLVGVMWIMSPHSRVQEHNNCRRVRDRLMAVAVA